MKVARLDGPSHEMLGSIAAIAEDAAAITLSRGGAAKTYAYVDPNEDAVAFAVGAGGSFVAVADGHHGSRGSVRAIDVLLRDYAAGWTDLEWTDPSVKAAASGAGNGAAEAERPPGALSAEVWQAAALAMLQQIHESVIAQGREIGIAPAPTTLCVALVRPEDGVLLHASVGDSHVFSVPRGGRAQDLAWATRASRRTFFLGDAYEGGALDRAQSVIGCTSLQDLEAVVLATDGLSEKRIGVEDPAAAVDAAVGSARASLVDLRALESCRTLTETAIEAHRSNAAGDNIGTAVVWLGT